MIKKENNESIFYIIGSFLIVVSIAVFTFYHTYNYIVNQKEEKMAENVINNSKINETTNDNQDYTNTNETKENDQEIYNYIGVLEIPKINFKRGFLNINDKNNTIEKNIQVIQNSSMPDVYGGLLVIAAHSGYGRVAFFNKLDKLKVDDLIYIYYKNVKYIYKVQKCYEENKDGDINIEKSNSSTLILTTCSQTDDNKQIIINSTLIETTNY